VSTCLKRWLGLFPVHFFNDCFFEQVVVTEVRTAFNLSVTSYENVIWDVVQDSVLSTYMCRNRLESMNRWRSWLLVSIHNRAIEVVRKAESGNIYTEELSAMNKDMSESDIHRALIEQEALD